MTGKTYTQTIEFKGTFNATNVLNSLKEVRASMAKAGADSNLFKNVDKDIASTEKLITQMLAQIQKGFSNPQELNNFRKNFDKLDLSFNKIRVSLQDINKAGNFNMNIGEIQKYTNEIDRLAAQQESLKKAAKDSIAAQLSKISTTAKERKAIMDEVEAEGDLEAAIKKVAQAREQTAKARNYKKGLETDTGQAVLAEEASGVNATDFGLNAKKGHSKMGTNDARTRKSGRITGLDEAKAAEVFAASYKKTLEEVLKNGGNAIDAINKMKQAMDAYGVEISEEDKLLDSFSSSIENFINKALSDSQRKGIQTGQSLGSTDARGNFSFSETGQSIANNESYRAALQVERELKEAVENRAKAMQAGEQQNAENVNKMNRQLEESVRHQKELGEETQKATNDTREQIQAANDVSQAFDGLKNTIKNFLSLRQAIVYVRQAIQQTFNDIKSLDKSFANIAMVTDYSVQDMWNSYDQYAQMANELGQSTKSVIEASGLYYQQGLDTNEALELTQDTMKLATLAGLDFSEATSQMTAALRGFKMEMDEGNRVTDVYAELAAKAAADVEGIATAMSKTASIASSAGMEFETTSAFLTQMIETTQEAPTNIGTAMKTIIARFTELKENVAGTADSEFDDLDYNKVDTALKSVGVSLKDANGQFRDLDDVFLELASKWSTLDRNSQRYIATIAAGARQQSRFIAMMDNYDRTMELVNVAYDSNGKASEQFGKYSDTLEYKLNQLTNTWEQMRLKFLNSDFLKGAVDLLTKFVSSVGDMDAKQLISIAVIGITVGKMIITNLVDSLKEGSASVQKAWKNLLNTTIPKKGDLNFKGVGQAFLLKEGNTKEEFLSNSHQILGNRNIETNLEPKVEIAKTQQLQKQLQIYDQLRIKQEELKQKAIQEHAARGKITSETKRQYASQQEMSAEQLKAINRLMEELGYEKQITAENAKQISQEMQQNTIGKSRLAKTAVSSAKSATGAALTTGITMAIGGADMETIMVTAGTTLISTFVTSIIPTILEAAVSAMTTIVAAIGAIPLAIFAAIAVIGIGIAWFVSEQEKAEQATRDAEINRLKDIQKINDELHKKQIENLKESANAEKQIQSLDEALETYNTLSNKSVRTQEEDEQLSDAINTLNNDFSDIVLAYDENNQKLIMSTEATDRLREELEQQRDNAAQEAQLNMTQSVEGTKNAAKFAAELSTEYSKKAQNEFNQIPLDFEEEVKTGLSLFTGHEDILAKVYDTLNLDKNDIKTEEDFLKALEESGHTVLDFRKAMSEATDSLSKELNGDALAEARKGAEDYYSTLTINGEQISGELARSLSYAIEDVDFDTSLEDFADKTSQGAETNKNFLRDYLQDYQETGKVGNDAGVQKELQGLTFGDKTADEIIKAKIDEFKESGKTLMDGFDGNLSEWTELPEDFQNWAKSEGMDEKTFEDIRKDASESKKLLDKYFYQLFLAESEAFGLLTEEEIQANSEDLGQINQLFNEAGDYTKEQFLALLSNMVANLPEEVKNGILAGQGLKWDENSKSVVETGEAIENSAVSKYDEYIKAVSAYGVSGAEKVSQDFNKAILDYIEQFGLQGQQATDFAQQMIDNAAFIDEEAIQKFYSLDFGNMSSIDLDKAKEEYIEFRKEAVGDIEQVEDEWDTLVNMSKDSGIIEFKISGIDSIDDITDQTMDSIKEITDGFDSLSTTIKNQAQNGFIDWDDYYDAYNALQEMGLEAEEYFKSNDDGTWSFAYEEAADAAAAQLNNTEQLVAEIEAAIQAKIDEIDMNIALLNGDYSRVDAILDQNASLEVQLAFLNQIGIAQAQLNDTDWTRINIPTITANIQKMTKDQRKASIDALTETKTALGKELKDKTYKENLANYQLAGTRDIYNTLNNSIQEGIDAKNKDSAASGGAADSAEDLAKAEEELLEAQKELNEALYGTENYKNAADHLANYTERLEELTDKANKAKESLENLGKEDSASELIATYAENVKLDNITRTAENQVLQQSMDDLLKILNENYSEYFQKIGDTWMWNASVVDAPMNDNEKDFIIESIENLNEYQDQIDENLDAIEEREKEFKEMRKTALDSRITLEEEVMDVLKENYQQEIDTVQEKYDALKEADDNYLDALEEAINKQRELRDRANQYEDLAQKERKLALKQRDTSGTNRKDTLQLQKEVEESRQEMLDNEVDRLLDSMKEMYELQQESREAEIEYMNAMMENSQLLQEANEIIASFSTREDMLAWFFENNKELADMSVAATEKYKIELEEMYDAAELYYVMSETNLEELTSFTEEEVSDTIATIGETLTLEAERSYNEMRETVDKEVEDARKAVEDAAKSAADAVGSAAGAIVSTANDIKNVFADAGEQKTIAQQYALNSVQAVEAWNAAHPDQKVSTDAALAENGKKTTGIKTTGSGNKNKTTTASPTSYGALKAQEYTKQVKQQAALKNVASLSSSKSNTSFRIDHNNKKYYFENEQDYKKAKEYLNSVDIFYYSYKKERQGNAIKWIKDMTGQGRQGNTNTPTLTVGANKIKIPKNKNGGLVDYTGLAWVDGTTTKPEAFLSAEDTKRIGEAAKLLSNLPILNSTSNASTQLSTNVGDTSIEIHINVESISSDYDVDRLAERIKSDIVDASKPVGTPVILKR